MVLPIPLSSKELSVIKGFLHAYFLTIPFPDLFFIQYGPSALLLAGFLIAKVWGKSSFSKQLQGEHHRREAETHSYSLP